MQGHSPAAPSSVLVEPLTPFGCKFFVAEWGFRTPKPAMEPDTVLHLYPYARPSAALAAPPLFSR